MHINDLSSKQSKIRNVTLSNISTNLGGNGALGLSADDVIVVACRDGYDHIVLPYIAANKTWYVHITDLDFNPIGEQTSNIVASILDR